VSGKEGSKKSMKFSRKRTLARIPAALALAGVLAGCGALPVTLPLALPVLVSGAGGSVAYTVTNIAYKTFSYPIEEVKEATHMALEKMLIGEAGEEELEDGVKISATTKKLHIYIDLEKITPNTTKVSVNAKRGAVLKDKSTATEIISQIENFLEGGKEERESPVPVPAEAEPTWALNGGAGPTS